MMFENFNPRSRKGSDLSTPSVDAGTFVISIHAPARGATATHRNILRFCEFQSTLPQGERLCHPQNNTVQIQISIHAPARGATILWIENIKLFDISIHAPARGATESETTEETVEPDFNPRSRKGSDHTIICRRNAIKYFNPRSRKGSDNADTGK